MVKDLLNKALRENLVKNLLVVVFVFLFYGTISSSLKAISVLEISNFLMVISLLLVTVCFANFAFSYEYGRLENSSMRFLAHISTFVFMLLTAFLLEALVIAVRAVYPSLFAITLVFSIILYMGISLYDFWDFFRYFRNI